MLRVKPVGISVCVGVWLLISAPHLFATPSGLNNIPTSDIVPHQILVLQQFTNFGSDQIAVFTAGVKYGLVPDVEIGIDDRVGTTNSSAAGMGASGAGGAPAGPVVGQVKYRFLNDEDGLSAAVGVANISDSKRAGNEAVYLALKHNLNPKVRGHVGFLTSAGNDAFYLGADGDFGTRGWVWRADAIQTNDGDDELLSVGAIGPVSDDVIVEGWVSFPTESGISETFTLKFNYVFSN